MRLCGFNNVIWIIILIAFRYGRYCNIEIDSCYRG
ncbi:MAG: hypothetical protein K0R78_172 [Pelosinus sp.]|jgi:hypothetical protein|nr:hypothetical protein [Pelosinus sp.]